MRSRSRTRREARSIAIAKELYLSTATTTTLAYSTGIDKDCHRCPAFQARNVGQVPAADLYEGFTIEHERFDFSAVPGHSAMACFSIKEGRGMLPCNLTGVELS